MNLLEEHIIYKIELQYHKTSFNYKDLTVKGGVLDHSDVACIQH